MGQAGTSSEGKSQQHRLSLQPSISSASTGSLSPPEPATATERQGLAPASSCSAAVAAAAVAAAAADGFGGGGNIGDGSDGQRLISFQTVQGWSNASEASRPDGRVVTTQPSLRQLDSRIAIGPAATTLMRHASCVTQWPSAPRVHNATTRTASQLRSMDLVNSSAGALRTVSNPQSPQLPRPEGGQKVWHEVTAKLVHDPLLGRELILLTHADHTAHMEAAKRTADLLKSEHAVLEKLFPRHVIEHMVAANAPSVIGGGSSNHGGSSRGAASGSVPITPAFFDEIGRPLVSLARGSASDAGYHGGSGQGSECGVAAANGSNSGQSVSMPMRLLTEAAAPSSAASNPESLSTYHKQVTIMFADIVEFTSMCKVLPPSTIMAFLNKLYSAFDELVSIFNVYKVETVGDCYIVAGGLMHKDQDGYTSVLTDVHELHALAVLQFAKAMLSEAGKILNPATGEPVQMRVGMHSGPIVSGVIGTKMPRFCLFGDSMNTAQRMESASRPGGIHVSEATQRLLPKECWLPTDGVELKGLGKCPTYFWAPRESRKRPQRVARTASMIDLSFLKVDEGDGGSPDLCVVINEEQEAAGGMSSRGSTGGTWGGSTGADTSGRLAAPTWSASKMLLASATGSSRGLLPPPLPPPSRCSRKAFGNSKSSTLASMGSATLDGLLAGLAASSLLDDEESSAAAAAAEAEVGNDDDDGEDDAINTSTCALFAGCVLTD